MITASIFEAKTNLSELVKRAQQGEAVTITSGRNRKPVARLEAIHPVAKKRLGALAKPGFMLTPAFSGSFLSKSFVCGAEKVSEGSARHPHSAVGGTFSFFSE